MRLAPPRALKIPNVAVFECGCGTMYHAADGQLPVGWTQRSGTVWCDDCTRQGIPTRVILTGGYPKRNRKVAA